MVLFKPNDQANKQIKYAFVTLILYYLVNSINPISTVILEKVFANRLTCFIKPGWMGLLFINILALNGKHSS